MLRFVSRFSALALALVLLHGAAPGQGRRADPPPAKDDAKASPELQAWINTLTEKMTDRQDSIRDSARSALVAVGRPALPALQKLMDSKDAAAAEAAKLVIARIEGGRGTGGRGTGGPGGPGGPGGRFPGGAGEPGETPRGPGGRGAGGSVDQALKGLDLSEKQKTKLEEIKDAQQKKLSELTEKGRDGKLDRDELRTAFEKNREEMLKDIKGVLTKEQIEKFEKALKDAPPAGPGGPGGRGPGGAGGPGGGGRGGPGGGFPGGGGFGTVRGLTQALKDLDLTEKQQARVDKILAAQQDKSREMLDKLRDGKLDREEMRTAFEKAQEELLKNVKDVLTREQAEKLDKALKDGQRGGGRGGPGGSPGGRPDRRID